MAVKWQRRRTNKCDNVLIKIYTGVFKGDYFHFEDYWYLFVTCTRYMAWQFFVDFVASALTLLVRHHELHLASNNIISAVSKVLGPFESTRKLYNSHRAVCVWVLNVLWLVATCWSEIYCMWHELMSVLYPFMWKLSWLWKMNKYFCLCAFILVRPM